MLINVLIIFFLFLILNSFNTIIENIQNEGGGTETLDTDEELTKEENMIATGYTFKNRIKEMMNKLCGSDNCNEKKEGSTLLEIADNKNTLEDMKADLQQRLI